MRHRFARPHGRPSTPKSSSTSSSPAGRPLTRANAPLGPKGRSTTVRTREESPRSGRDSNPRDRFQPAGFQDRAVEPTRRRTLVLTLESERVGNGEPDERKGQPASAASDRAWTTAIAV